MWTALAWVAGGVIVAGLLYVSLVLWLYWKNRNNGGM